MNYKIKRDKVIKLLGEKCVRCGFADRRALQIDHVYSNGAEERRRYGMHATGVVYDKILAGERGDYQLLCANCNWIKRAEVNENSAGRAKMRERIRRESGKVKRRRNGIYYDLSGVPK